MKRKSCVSVIAASMAVLVALSGWAAEPFMAYASPAAWVPSVTGAAVLASGECGAEGSTVTWTFYECGVLVISGTGKMADFHWDSGADGSDAPWIAQGFGQSIEDVVIGSGVTNVGDYAFAGCATLESVQLPNSLARIGSNTFENCSKLRIIAIPSCKIGDRAFGGCGNLSAIYFDGVSGLNLGQGGDEPNGIHPFGGATATAYYRGSDPWADGDRESLGNGANLTWVALDDGEFESRAGADTLGDDDAMDNGNGPSSEAQQSGSWQKNNVGWWWQYSDGTYPASTWELINENWYYFNSSGYMATGWQFLDGHWYYLGGADDGVMKTGWQQVGGTWYFMYPNGEMASDTYIDNYYVDASGARVQTGSHGQNGGNTAGSGISSGSNSSSKPDGLSGTGSWVRSGNRWWYRHPDGGYTMNGWEFINGKWYYFDAAGWMVTGWRQVNGLWYYMDQNGAMKTGWLQLKDTWYYLYDNGAMATDTWIGNDYVDASGAWVPDAGMGASVNVAAPVYGN